MLLGGKDLISIQLVDFKPDDPSSYVTLLASYPCQVGIQVACVCISTACLTYLAVNPTPPLSLLARGTSLHMCGQTEPRRSEVLEGVCCELSSGSVLLSGLPSAQPSASLDLMEKSLNCGGAGGQEGGRDEREKKREREGRGRKGTKGEEKSGSTTVEKSESCSCASGRIATSSVLNTLKHQKKYSIFQRQSGILTARTKMEMLAVSAIRMAGMFETSVRLTEVMKTMTPVGVLFFNDDD